MFGCFLNLRLLNDVVDLSAFALLCALSITAVDLRCGFLILACCFWVSVDNLRILLRSHQVFCSFLFHWRCFCLVFVLDGYVGLADFLRCAQVSSKQSFLIF